MQTMTEQAAKTLASEFAHNKHWCVRDVYPSNLPGQTDRWCVLIVSHDLTSWQCLRDDDASTLRYLREITKVLATPARLTS